LDRIAKERQLSQIFFDRSGNPLDLRWPKRLIRKYDFSDID
jgi:hypothetical protein